MTSGTPKGIYILNRSSEHSRQRSPVILLHGLRNCFTILFACTLHIIQSLFSTFFHHSLHFLTAQNNKLKNTSAEIIQVKSYQVRSVGDGDGDETGGNMNSNQALSVSKSGELRPVSARERWDILLEKAGFGLQSLRRIAKLSRLNTAPFDKDWSLRKKQNSNLNGLITNNSNVSVTCNQRVDLSSPVQHNTNKCTRIPASDRLSAEKACLAKDPSYVGWAKIIGRRLRLGMIERRKKRVHSEVELEMFRSTTNDSGIASEMSFVDELTPD